MVYDGTKLGLNDAMWVPRFLLLIVNRVLRAVESSMVMGDIDMNEMFLIFILHESVQALCGVDLTKCFRKGKVLRERWVRCTM